ncbi:MAG TPA: hypothetical protein VFV75_14955 [Candidatus Polarisedimenticolaceae bacterium]|nr:hypothetical protein [Candidatus Polarisedimenticolaceae bacterium]
MQASVRILAIAAVGAAALVLMLLAGAPAALAYDDPGPSDGKVIKAWNPRYTVVHFARKVSNEGGPVELPHPVDPPAGSFSASPGVSAPDMGGKLEATSLSSGALPAARGGGAIVSPAARAERSIQQLIRRLG